MTSEISQRFRRVADAFDRVVQSVPADRWDAPSPCDEWMAIDIVEHVASTQLVLLSQQPFAPSVEIDVAADPVGAWPVVRGLVQAALDDPASCDHAYDGFFGPTTFGATIDSFYALDLVVHTWDLATAAGLDELRAIDVAEMSAVVASLAPLRDNMRQPGLFGPEIEVGADADEQTRFLAFLGRS